jgi:hypothetical protein
MTLGFGCPQCRFAARTRLADQPARVPLTGRTEPLDSPNRRVDAGQAGQAGLVFRQSADAEED